MADMAMTSWLQKFQHIVSEVFYHSSDSLNHISLFMKVVLFRVKKCISQIYCSDDILLSIRFQLDLWASEIPARLVHGVWRLLLFQLHPQSHPLHHPLQVHDDNLFLSHISKMQPTRRNINTNKPVTHRLTVSNLHLVSWVLL